MCVVKGLLQEIKTRRCQLQRPDVTPSDRRMLIDRVRKGDRQRKRERERGGGGVGKQSVLDSSHLGTDAMS